MKRSLTLALAAAGFAAAIVPLLAQSFPGRIVDLGHPIRPTDPSWDGKAAYERATVATVAKDGYTAGRISIEEHFGTHVDAPAHFAANGWTVDRIPVDRLQRPGVKIDVVAKAAADADYRVTVADVKAFEAQHGPIAEGTIVLVATGWDSRWPDRARYMNEKDGVKHFPGLSVEADTYLARDRKVAAIGIDTPSIDYGASSGFEAHRVSMGLNVYHIENAARLTTLPAKDFTVIVAPIAVVGGSGGPARVFALLK